ncbi:MAG TPA: abortive infection protein, partial [Pilimelia sp.]|nr:abortive infection protein [Pilimelia sp.]
AHAGTRAPAGPRPAPRTGLAYRSIGYDVGTAFAVDWPVSRLVWGKRLMRAELRMIHQDLHANTVGVFGNDVGRLVDTAREALRRGMRVTIQPRLFEHPPAEALAPLAETARAAESLRAAYGPEVILVVGCEFMLFTPGILPGASFPERVAYLRSPGADFPAAFRRLAGHVREAVAVARRHFGGRLTYGAAAGLERIDWSLFDIVGLDYYSYHPTRAGHAAELAPFRAWGKPIMILEFGCCTYTGAPERGGMGWDVTDYSVDPPVLLPGLVRDEREQARHLASMLAVFAAEGLLGASPYQFVAPDAPHLPGLPRQDWDTASFAVCATIRADPDDEASPYTLRPKRAFHAVARHYRGG